MRPYAACASLFFVLLTSTTPCTCGGQPDKAQALGSGGPAPQLIASVGGGPRRQMSDVLTTDIGTGPRSVSASTAVYRILGESANRWPL